MGGLNQNLLMIGESIYMILSSEKGLAKQHLLEILGIDPSLSFEVHDGQHLHSLCRIQLTPWGGYYWTHLKHIQQDRVLIKH